MTHDLVVNTMSMNVRASIVTLTSMDIMRARQILFCVFCGLIIRCSALTCRTSGGPSIEELKSIYRTCLKHQDNRSNSGSSEETNKGRRTQDNQGSQGRYNNHDDWSSMGDFAGHPGGMGGSDWSDGNRSPYDRSKYNDRGMNTNNDVTTRSSDTMGRNGNNMNRNIDHMHGMSSDHMTRNGYMGDQFSTQDMPMPRYNYPQPSPSARRYRRDKTSGHRSQYNPNTSWKTLGHDESYKEDQSGSSENSTSKSERKKACALHCFMQEFEMIGDDDMPDKYMVVQGLTKYANNDDLRDFLQEAVEECFQIVQNENRKDKCEFSKILGLCLSEKGRANCEDWKEELKL